MKQMIIRAAQSAFNRADYTREDGYRYARLVAWYMLTNYGECCDCYGVQDAVELADVLAKAIVSEARSTGGRPGFGGGMIACRRMAV